LREGRWERLDPPARRWDEKVPTWGGCGVRRMRCGEGLWHGEDAPTVWVGWGERGLERKKKERGKEKIKGKRKGGIVILPL
jgi:hypothetical protein